MPQVEEIATFPTQTVLCRQPPKRRRPRPVGTKSARRSSRGRPSVRPNTNSLNISVDLSDSSNFGQGLTRISETVSHTKQIMESYQRLAATTMLTFRRKVSDIIYLFSYLLSFSIVYIYSYLICIPGARLVEYVILRTYYVIRCLIKARSVQEVSSVCVSGLQSTLRHITEAVYSFFTYLHGLWLIGGLMDTVYVIIRPIINLLKIVLFGRMEVHYLVSKSYSETTTQTETDLSEPLGSCLSAGTRSPRWDSETEWSEHEEDDSGCWEDRDWEEFEEMLRQGKYFSEKPSRRSSYDYTSPEMNSPGLRRCAEKLRKWHETQKRSVTDDIGEGGSHIMRSLRSPIIASSLSGIGLRSASSSGTITPDNEAEADSHHGIRSPSFHERLQAFRKEIMICSTPVLIEEETPVTDSEQDFELAEDTDCDGLTFADLDSFEDTDNAETGLVTLTLSQDNDTVDGEEIPFPEDIRWRTVVEGGDEMVVGSWDTDDMHMSIQFGQHSGQFNFQTPELSLQTLGL